jgi:hypothetical protein
MISLTHLYLYPIKSMGGISLESSQVSDRGLQHDRRWMIVDEQGRFLSQRELPEMAQISLSATETGWRLTHKRKRIAPLEVPLLPQTDQQISVQIWDDSLLATRVNPQVDADLSHLLGHSCQLVYMTETDHRPADPAYAQAGELTSFADGFPFLLISQASLDGLNQRLDQPVPMDRFRPNLVLSGVQTPHGEDEWQQFQLGDIRFFPVKPSARCQIITIDQQTTQTSPEPLRTLSTYRKQGNKVIFGMNLLHQGEGELRVGMTVGHIVKKSDIRRNKQV